MLPSSAIHTSASASPSLPSTAGVASVPAAAARAGGPLRGKAPIFAALGDETRLQLIAVLCVGGAMSIARLTEGADITRQAVTKHLAVLADAGLVRSVKAGRERLWEFEPKELESARKALELISRQWDAALDRLRLAVEGPDDS
jgi:DNA-binding transcriptional ArsR family regulator